MLIDILLIFFSIWKENPHISSFYSPQHSRGAVLQIAQGAAKHDASGRVFISLRTY